MIGPGKYDDLCTEAREKAKARGAILLIFEGEKGFGFAVQLPPDQLVKVPAVLRTVAATIERDMYAELYEIAKAGAGFPWTDPRSGETHEPPR